MRPKRFTDYELFIFDLDGTIVSSREMMLKALARCHALDGGRGPVPYNEFFSMMGAPLEVIFRQLGWGDDLVAEYRRLSRASVSTIPLHRDVGTVLRRLARVGRRLSLFTGKDLARTRELLGRHSLSGLFARIVTSDDVENGKPHPEGILNILERTGICPDRAVMVGDGAYDVAAAHEAGIDSAFVAWGTGDAAVVNALAPRWSFRTPEELRRAVEQGLREYE